MSWRRPGGAAHALCCALTLGIAVPPLAGCGSGSSSQRVVLAYRIVPSGVRAPSPRAVERTVTLVQQRARLLVGRSASVQRRGNQVLITVKGAAPPAEVQASLGRRARLRFYDWEASALTPRGVRVADGLGVHDPVASAISQGSGGGAAAGSAAAFGLPLSDAMKLAARPDGRRAAQQLATSGKVVLEAVPSAGVRPPAPGHPSARFFVLRDQPALSGMDITAPQATRDQSGLPAVSFAFTARGGMAFRRMTGAVARRGAQLSGGGVSLYQHVAIAVDGQLLSVPFIDYQLYPDGIPGGQGAQVAGGLTPQAARELAVDLRYGPLPLELEPAAARAAAK